MMFFPHRTLPQGARKTLWANEKRGPANGRCEIVAPNGAVVASFVSIAGGVDNGWRAQVNYQGWDVEPSFTVEVPKNAPVGDGYRICTATYLWPQSSACFDVVARGTVAATDSPFVPTPIATPILTRQVDAMIRGASDMKFLGQNKYDVNGESAGQISEQVAVVGKVVNYQIRLQNKSERAASFKLDTLSRSKNWTIRYFDAAKGGKEITSAMAEGSLWNTPVIPAGGQFSLRAELKSAPNGEVAAWTMLRVMNEQGAYLDSVRAFASRQSLARIEVSIDKGETWETATVRGVAVPEATIVRFRAVKKIAVLSWPDSPIKPQWEANGVVFMTGDEARIKGERGRTTVVAGQCGNLLLTMIHVLPKN